MSLSAHSCPKSEPFDTGKDNEGTHMKVLAIKNKVLGGSSIYDVQIWDGHGKDMPVISLGDGK